MRLHLIMIPYNPTLHSAKLKYFVLKHFKNIYSQKNNILHLFNCSVIVLFKQFSKVSIEYLKIYFYLLFFLCFPERKKIIYYKII